MSDLHKCFTEVDEMLAERNTRLTFPIVLFDNQEPLPLIVTEQIETGRGKKKATAIFAAFCPFCGEQLRAEPA